MQAPESSAAKTGALYSLVERPVYRNKGRSAGLPCQELIAMRLPWILTALDSILDVLSDKREEGVLGGFQNPRSPGMSI
jgi:hypothetical protein